MAARGVCVAYRQYWNDNICITFTYRFSTPIATLSRKELKSDAGWKLSLTDNSAGRRARLPLRRLVRPAMTHRID